ncbi:MAG: hypothetical protein K0U72_14365 [Gammaproteobacteria bacterium]|nr:hypothetical protein [Gammaproteobacteria bacterium]
MKSLLVDAMRQANKGDSGSTLSDSGSFDTTSDEFTETANDAVVTVPGTAADELQLLDADTPESDSPLAEVLDEVETLPELLQDPETTSPTGGRELSAKFAVADIVAPVVSKAPRLSRLSAVICLTLFLTSGVVWTVWQKWHDQAAASALGVSWIPGESTRSETNSENAAANTERFPFIAATLTAPGDEVEE